MTAIIMLIAAIIMLLAIRPAVPQRHGATSARRSTLHLAEAPECETFTFNGQEWMLVRDATRVRVVSMVTVKEDTRSRNGGTIPGE